MLGTGQLKVLRDQRRFHGADREIENEEHQGIKDDNQWR